MPWKTRFLSSLESCSPPCCSEVATFCKPGVAGERAGDRRAGAFPSVSSHSLSIHKARQQLLFLNSPFSVMESLVGLVGEMPLRTCMLYRSFTWVSALISLVLAESSDTIRFSYNTPIMALFWLHAGNYTVIFYWMTVLMLSIKQQYTWCFPDKWNVSASFCTLVRPASPEPNGSVFIFSLFSFQHSKICY